jgi:hypothetical protein
MCEMKKNLREIRRMVERIPGVDKVCVDYSGSNHLRIQVTSRGDDRLFITAGSPSDVRGRKNLKSDIKRWVQR